MKVIYENQVKAAGAAVEEFKDAGMFIIFGDNAPEEIRDYCYSVSVNPINGEIAAGQSGTLHLQLQRSGGSGAARHHISGGEARAGA